MNRTICAAPLHPDVLAALRADPKFGETVGIAQGPPPIGRGDGAILPASDFPVGTPRVEIVAAASARAHPLRGDVKVVVVLAEFRDRRMTKTQQQVGDLFFSTGVIPTGSVHEYYHEVSHGLVSITGTVVGPFVMPLTLAEYAAGDVNTPPSFPNVQTLGRDAARAAMAQVNFSSFDNDGNGFVDALVVVHAGSGRERTANPNDLWSIKHHIEGGELIANQTSILSFLTVAEDSPMGIAAHELGHLLFGWPDLYDHNQLSNGAGSWCLMGYGSWNGQAAGAQPGDVPAHPSAWCKMTQGWVTALAPQENGTLTVEAVQESKKIYRLWKDATTTPEYFLLENRQRDGFDRALPGDGLLVWHIDDSRENNDDVSHPRIALMQADGARQLEARVNLGDDNDPFRQPAERFDDTSQPSSRSYSGLPTSVAVTTLSPSGPSIDVDVRVTEPSAPPPGRGRIVHH